MSVSEYKYHEVIISTYDSCISCAIMIDGVKDDVNNDLFDIVYNVDALCCVLEERRVKYLQKSAEGIAWLKGWGKCAVRIIACGDGDVFEHSFIIDEPEQFKEDWERGEAWQ